MKTRKMMRWGRSFLLGVILCSGARLLHPFSFDGRLTPTVVDYTPTLTNGDYIRGAVIFNKGFTVASNATVHYGSSLPVYGRVTLNDSCVLSLLDSVRLEIIETNFTPMAIPTRATIVASLRNGIKSSGFNFTTCGPLKIITASSGWFTWDFDNGFINTGVAPNNGNYNSERGLFFVTPSATINLQNAVFWRMWANDQGVPLIRFNNINWLQTFNCTYMLSTNYTMSSMGNFVAYTATSFTGIGKTLTWNLGTPAYPAGQVSGLYLRYEDGLKIAVTGGTRIVKAGPVFFTNNDLTIGTTVTFLSDPAPFLVDGNLRMDNPGRYPVDFSTAIFDITAGSKIILDNISSLN